VSSEHVDLSVLPIGVGFDLRVAGIAIMIPATTRSVAYDLDGEEQIMRGTTTDIVTALRRAGYAVLDEVTP